VGVAGALGCGDDDGGEAQLASEHGFPIHFVEELACGANEDGDANYTHLRLAA